MDPKVIADNKLAFGHLGHVATVVHEHDRRHIARHDPSRVLADVQSKREIIAQFDARFSDDFVWHPILAALARPYLAQETP